MTPTLPNLPLASEGQHHALPKRYSRWRAGTLLLVYVLMAAHIAHWRITGKTLAPLELNEVMHTLELGIVTAGFVFMTVAVVSVLIFGRFFCSWGCHILALQDLCSWLLDKVGIHPKPVRSRVLLLVPPAALFYMFVWPQVARLLEGRAAPRLRLTGDESGWASFVTNDFWRNLPGPGIALLTFGVCGFLIVYVLGSRSFCRYGCPYGALFALADRVAPGRLVALGGCTGCGTCTANCQSDIRVHEELAAYGTVVNSACMKDLDCLSVCPSNAIGYRFTRPSLFRKKAVEGRPRTRFGFTFGEESLMSLAFLAALFTFRGLYGTVPFLLSLGLAGILSYLSVIGLRLVRREAVRCADRQLKLSGRLTQSGMVFALALSLALTFVLHSAFIRYEELASERSFERVMHYPGGSSKAPSEVVLGSIAHFELLDRFGLVRPRSLDRKLASLHVITDSPRKAEPYLLRALEEAPRDLELRLTYGRMLHRAGDRERTLDEIRAVIAAASSSEGDAPEDVQYKAGIRASAHELLGGIRSEGGEFPAAIAAYESAISDRPRSPAARLALGELLGQQGRFADAAAHLEVALELVPGSSPAHYNLAVMLSQLGRDDEALQHYRVAGRLDPTDAEIQNNLGFLLAKRGERAEAERCFRSAIRLRPDFAHPHFNLGRLLYESGKPEEAFSWFERAAGLDRYYAEWLRQARLSGG